MANHDYTRAGGVWAPLSAILTAELADLDAKTVDSLSATGGVYSLTEHLQIGGSPGLFLLVDVDASFSSQLFVGGLFETNGEVYFASSSTFTVDCETTFNGDVHFDGGGATFDHTATFNHNVNLGSDSGDDIYVYGSFDVQAAAAFRDTVVLTKTSRLAAM